MSLENLTDRLARDNDTALKLLTIGRRVRQDLLTKHLQAASSDDLLANVHDLDQRELLALMCDVAIGRDNPDADERDRYIDAWLLHVCSSEHDDRLEASDEQVAA
jgi:hypothetical protein